MSADRPIRVLVVDDHALLRHSLCRVLEDAGFQVAGEASDGEEALRRAADVAPDVVLMDVTMPVLDGIETTRRLRRILPHLPVVVLTMHDDPDLVASAHDAGASGYLLKDCTIEEVSGVVRLAAARVDRAPDPSAATTDSSPGAAQDPSGLSAREREVLALLATGMTTEDLGRALYISAKTVKNHLRSIYGKLGVRSRTEAVARAARLGLVRLD